MCNQQRLGSACAYAQSDQSHCKLLEYSMTVKLLTEHHLELLSLKGGFTGLPESTLVKMPHCWISNMFMNELSTCLIINYFEALSWWSPRPVTKRASVSFPPSVWYCSFDKDTLSWPFSLLSSTGSIQESSRQEWIFFNWDVKQQTNHLIGNVHVRR